MNQAITDKTAVLVTRLGDFWMKPSRAEEIMALKATDPSGHADLDGDFISFSSIDGVLSAASYEIYNMKRRGGWQCKYQKWHERNQQCAHHLQAGGR